MIPSHWVPPTWDLQKAELLGTITQVPGWGGSLFLRSLGVSQRTQTGRGKERPRGQDRVGKLRVKISSERKARGWREVEGGVEWVLGRFLSGQGLL